MIDEEVLEEGTRLGGGKYEVLHRLGRGGVALVYLARDAELCTRVALKILLAKRAEADDYVDRFLNEVKIAAALPAHPNIVRPYEMGRFAELDDRPFMSMEYAHGPTLGDLIIGQPLDAKKACRLLIDVADALVFLHGRGIIHRDVKPSNIVVTRDGGIERARLLDFGYAFDQASFAAAPQDRLTQIDHRPGTKHYMAPEQARGELPAPSFDVYALAVTLYELLTGNPPYYDHSPKDVVMRKVDPTQPSFSIEGERADLPSELVELVDRGLQRDASNRIASAAEFREGLNYVLTLLDRGGRTPTPFVPVDGQPMNAVTVTPFVPHAEGHGRTSNRRAWVPWLSLLVVGMVLGGIGVWFLGQGTPSPEPREEQPSAPVVVAAPSESVPTEPVATTLAATESPSAGREPDRKPEPAAAPELAPSEPPNEASEPPPKRVRKNKPRPTPAKDDTEDDPPGPPCSEVVADAQVAERGRRWAELAQLTRRKDCWPSAGKRLRLQVSALYHLGRYAQCVEAARKSSDPEVLRIAKPCESRLAEEQAP